MTLRYVRGSIDGAKVLFVVSIDHRDTNRAVCVVVSRAGIERDALDDSIEETANFHALAAIGAGEVQGIGEDFADVHDHDGDGDDCRALRLHDVEACHELVEQARRRLAVGSHARLYFER